MKNLEGFYQLKGDSLYKEKGSITLSIHNRRPTLIKPPLYLMSEESTGLKYVSSLWEYSEGGYIFNDRMFTYQLSTAKKGVSIEVMSTSN